MHILWKKDVFVELKAYREEIWDEIYLKTASTPSYSAIIHCWVTVHLFQNNCMVIFSPAVLQWFWIFSIGDNSSCSFFLLCFPNRCSSTNPRNFLNQSLALGLSTRLLLTNSFCCGIVISCLLFSSTFCTLSLTPGHRISQNLWLSQMADNPLTRLHLHINKLYVIYGRKLKKANLSAIQKIKASMKCYGMQLTLQHRFNLTNLLN